jgi:pyruvate/2-oxoglutarate dehydrogenase complex dihydrolipoamide dehydrogenase (E3) component
MENVSSAQVRKKTNPKEYDLVILGGGTGSTIAAWTFAKQGQRVAAKADGNRILGFTGFGVGAGEVLSSVQMAMAAGLPYTALRDAMLTHPTLVEGLIPLFSSAPSVPKSAAANNRIN